MAENPPVLLFETQTLLNLNLLRFTTGKVHLITSDKTIQRLQYDWKRNLLIAKSSTFLYKLWFKQLYKCRFEFYQSKYFKGFSCIFRDVTSSIVWAKSSWDNSRHFLQSTDVSRLSTCCDVTPAVTSQFQCCQAWIMPWRPGLGSLTPNHSF